MTYPVRISDVLCSAANIDVPPPHGTACVALDGNTLCFALFAISNKYQVLRCPRNSASASSFVHIANLHGYIDARQLHCNVQPLP